MTTTGNLDPVNGWATEHYGFDDDALPSGAPGPAGTASSDRRTSLRGAPRPGATGTPRLARRLSLAAAGIVLGFALIAGIGGMAVANAGDNVDGSGGGLTGGGRDRVATLFNGGGRADGPGGGHR